MAKSRKENEFDSYKEFCEEMGFDYEAQLEREEDDGDAFRCWIPPGKEQRELNEKRRDSE